MATRNVVPRSDDEGGIGTALKRWAAGCFNALSCAIQTVSNYINLTGGQVKFPAAAVPSADVNTLDDYEEGVFEATLFCGTSGTITLSAGTEGKYTKVGNVVTVSVVCEVASVSSPLGRLILSSLPFPAGAAFNGSVWGHDLNAGFGTVIVFSCESGGDSPYIDRMNNGVLTLDVAAALKAGSGIRFCGSYLV